LRIVSRWTAPNNARGYCYIRRAKNVSAARSTAHPKAAATADLRALVTKHRDAGSRVLIVPVLLSYGGIEQGIKTRLESFEYAIAPKAIMPDDRLELWVKQQAGS